MLARRLTPPLLPLFLLLLLPLSGCAEGKAATSEPPSPDEQPELVAVQAVAMESVQRQIETTGYLESEHRVEVLSKISGKLIEVVVDEGQGVTKGEKLGLLDDREAKAAHLQLVVQRAQADLEWQTRKLTAESAAREVQQAEIERDKTKAEYERNLKIEKGIVPPKTMDEVRFAAEAAVQALQVAEFNERKAGLDVLVAFNRTKELDARIEESNVRLEDHCITSPLDGVIARRYVHGGETIGPSTPLFEVVDPVNLIAWLNRPQKELELVRNAKEVRFTTDSQREHEYIADVDVVRPVVDRETGKFQLRMRVRPEGREKLLPGMFVRARILTEKVRQALMVPKAAVLSEGDRSIVFAVRNGKVYEVDLDPGLELENSIECRNLGDDGLQPGDQVVVSGHADLKDQDPVRVAGS